MQLKPTLPAKKVSEGHRRCTQSKCGYYLTGFCQECQKGCHARPYEINDKCKFCLSCEGEEGYLRFGDDKLQQELHIPQFEDDGVILIMNSKPSKGLLEQEKMIEREITR